MNDILRIREICKAHKSCYECPLHIGDECLICIPPSNLDNEQLYQIEKVLGYKCGIEESGFHAYNCNDCPNKCAEWYQWDKEFRGMKND